MKQTRATQHLEKVAGIMDRVEQMGIALQSTEDEVLTGRTITLQDRQLINFGSCSYLGWEQDPRIKAGVIDALERYGSQFSSSRAYVSLGLYEELEALLSQIFGAPVIATASTSLGHLSALPVLVGENDAVILDHQVHASVSMAAQVLKTQGCRVEMVRHNHLDMLEGRIQRLSQEYDRIWYLADGMYSMYGDFAPLEGLQALLSQYEQLRLYIDDAHSISWTGSNGAGKAAPVLAGHPQVYLAASLNKSFAAAGGVLIFPDEASQQLVRRCGGTMIFSGPIQPPMLGAAIASAQLHLSEELPPRQARLMRKIRLFNRMAELSGLPLAGQEESPIRFITVGKPEIGYRLVEALMEKGYYANLAVYPSVPQKNTGLRITLNHHLHQADIMNLINAVAYELPRMLQAESYSMEEVSAAFQRSKAS